MKNTPLVSVLMTAFNAEKYIGAAIESIINQSYENWEMIIVDDGSSDETAAIAGQFARKDRRIKLYKTGKNVGPSHASNLGLSKIRGEYLARMDADDIAYPMRIKKQLAYLTTHPEIVIVGGQCTLIDATGALIGDKLFLRDHEAIYRSLYWMNPIQHPTCMINLKLLPNQTFTYHNGSMLAHDLEMVFELAQYGKLANMADKLLYYRQHADSLSLKNPRATFAATLAVRRKAVLKYSYRPTTRALGLSFAQRIAVTILPREILLPLFNTLRDVKQSWLKCKNVMRDMNLGFMVRQRATN